MSAPVTMAWLYEHHEFGRQVHETRWDADTGGTSDDFIGWTETELIARQPTTPLIEASDNLGAWLSAALDDPAVCDAMKADITAWFTALASITDAKGGA